MRWKFGWNAIRFPLRLVAYYPLGCDENPMLALPVSLGHKCRLKWRVQVNNGRVLTAVKSGIWLTSNQCQCHGQNRERVSRARNRTKNRAGAQTNPSLFAGSTEGHKPNQERSHVVVVTWSGVHWIGPHLLLPPPPFSVSSMSSSVERLVKQKLICCFCRCSIYMYNIYKYIYIFARYFLRSC